MGHTPNMGCYYYILTLAPRRLHILRRHIIDDRLHGHTIFFILGAEPDGVHQHRPLAVVGASED
jgi:hypothetical protein